jgi:hypothetical protein
MQDQERGKRKVNWLKHAFAIDSPEQIQPNETQHAWIEKFCNELVRRRLTAPALFTLEMSRPMNYISAQFLHFLQPFVTVIADKNEYENLTLFLEKRGSIEYICGRLEALEAGYDAQKKAGQNPSATEAPALQFPKPHDPQTP